MRIEKAGDLIFWTYYMIDWSRVQQSPSDVKCAECGRPMNLSEPAVDPRGQVFDGYVCHADKKLVWVRRS